MARPEGFGRARTTSVATRNTTACSPSETSHPRMLTGNRRHGRIWFFAATSAYPVQSKDDRFNGSFKYHEWPLVIGLKGAAAQTPDDLGAAEATTMTLVGGEAPPWVAIPALPDARANVLNACRAVWNRPVSPEEQPAFDAAESR